MMLSMVSLLKSTPESKEKAEFEKKKAEFIKKFRMEMVEQGLVNKLNKTYYLNIISQTNYGFYGYLHLVPGLSFSAFNAKIGEIQENLQVVWIMKVKKFKDHAEVKIVDKPLNDKTPFKAPDDWKPSEVFLGLSFSLAVNRVDVNEYCHYLCGGATRSGKTRLIYMILLCWILKCKVNEVEIYLSDISKDEYSYFEWVKHVRYYANSIDKLWMMLKYLKQKFEARKRTIGKYRAQGLATNIGEYNKINTQYPMSYCYVFIDEFSIITPKNSDRPAVKEQKQEMMDIICELEKVGAGMGIIMFVATQKPTKQELNDSIIKNQSAVRIGFRMNDTVSSEVIMEDGSARGLDPRYAVYSLAGGIDKDYLFSPNLDTNTMKDLLKPHIDPKYKKAPVGESVKENREENAVRNQKVTVIEKKPRKKKTPEHTHDVVEIPDF